MKISQIMTTDVELRRLPVVDSESCLVGIVSLNDLALLAEHEVGRKNRDLSAQAVTATLAAISAPREADAERATA